MPIDRRCSPHETHNQQSKSAISNYNHLRWNGFEPAERWSGSFARSRRRIEDALLLDGNHLIEEALTSGVTVDVAAFGGRLATSALATRLHDARTRVVVVSDAVVLDAMSPVQSPSGSVAIARRPAASLDRVLAKQPELVLLLHDVQDPGNVGAVVRAAEGCGATGVVCSERTADPFGWKALRGAMGSSFRMPLAVRQSLLQAIAAARTRGVRVYAATARGGVPLPECDLHVPAAIMLGGEGRTAG